MALYICDSNSISTVAIELQSFGVFSEGKIRASRVRQNFLASTSLRREQEKTLRASASLRQVLKIKEKLTVKA